MLQLLWVFLSGASMEGDGGATVRAASTVLMLAGFFEFGRDPEVHFGCFVESRVGGARFILLVWKRSDPSAWFATVQVFFELMSFPLIKKLTVSFPAHLPSVVRGRRPDIIAIL